MSLPAVPESILILAGRGTYPMCVAEGARAAGVKHIAVVALRGITSYRLRSFADSCKVFGVGELQSGLDWVVKTGIKHIVLAGQITPVALFTTRFDALSRKILRELPIKNAHTIFGRFIELLEAEGVQTLPSSCFMGAYLPGAGVLTCRAPDAREAGDIEFGHRIAMSVCDLDIGQTILVKEGMVLAVEAFEGTNATLRRGAKLGGKGAVCVKVAKNDHDMRFDIPVIGRETIKILRKTGISAVAYQANRLILLEREEVIAAANRLGIAMIGLDSGLPPAPVYSQNGC